MAGNKKFNTDLDVTGKIKVTNVHNGAGNVLTYNLGAISNRTYAELISDMGLATTAWTSTNYIPKSHSVYSVTQANINNWNTAFGWGNHSGLYSPINHSHTFASITDKPATYPPDAHTHSQYLTQETDPTVPAHVKSISAGNIAEWNESFKRRTSFVSNIDANDKSFLSGYYAIETANGTGNTNFPSNSAYGVFSRMRSNTFTTEMFYYNAGSMAFRTWYNSGEPSTWRVVWDNVNLTKLSQLSNDAGYITSSALSPYAQTSWVSANFDKYTAWNLQTNSVQRTSMPSGSNLNLVAGANVTINYSAGGTVTISAANSGVPTNMVTTDTTQTISGTKTFTGQAIFQGNESNNVEIFKTAPGVNQVASGLITRWYANAWKVGMKRGGGTDAQGYAFWFSSDSGSTYSEKALIKPDGYFVGAGFVKSGGTATQVLMADGSVKEQSTFGISSIPLATSTVVGGRKLFSDTVQNATATAVSATASRTYGIQVNAAGQMVVNVPWTNTVYSHPNSGATAGTYRSVTVNAQGHVTAGTNPTTLAGYGITDAMSTSHAANAITPTNINNWNTAFNWGNHSGLYAPINHSHTFASITDKPATYPPDAHTHSQYLTQETDPTVPAHVKSISTGNINNWNTAFGWGDHNGSYLPLSGGTINTNGITISGFTNPGASEYGGFRNTGTNLVLTGNSEGRSGIFFKSTANHPSDYGFIQFHSTGMNADGTTPASGEVNKLIIGVSNDPGDQIVLQVPGINDLKVSTTNSVSGTTLPTYTIWHAGNFNPDGKANAWENATAIGFSSGGNPNADNGAYPYIYHSTGGYIALATRKLVADSYIPKSHPVYNVTQANIDSWNTAQTLSVSQSTQVNQINISGGNSVTIENRFLGSFDGSRNPTDIKPNTSPKSMRADFAAAGTVGGTGNYAGVLTYAPWDGNTASTGDSSYQLAFINETGINGTGNPGLRLRKGIDTTWGSWISILTSVNGVTLDTTQTITGTKTFNNGVVATTFIKNGGTASQVLMADGSVKEVSTIGGSNYSAGTNISITGNAISVVSSPTFSGSVTAPAFYEGSLKSLKKNIKEFKTSGLSLVNQLDIVTFDRKDESAKNKIGIIADDSPKEFLSEELDAVDLYKTVFIQAKAIQELTEEVNNLRELLIEKLK